LRHQPLSFCLEKEQKGENEEEHLLKKGIIIYYVVEGGKTG